MLALFEMVRLEIESGFMLVFLPSVKPQLILLLGKHQWCLTRLPDALNP